MRVGIPTEIKNNEYRVAITPAGVAELTHRGHDVLVQAGAGDGSAISDDDFKAAGAQIVDTADEVWAEADLLLKVKEPIEAEYAPHAPGPDAVHLPAPGGVAGRAPTRCWPRAPPRSPTRPCRPPTARCRCWPR